MDIYKKNKKKRIQKKKLAFLIIVVMSIIIFIVGLFMVLTKGREISDTMIKLPFASNVKCFGMGQNIVYLDQEYLTCLDLSANIVWQLGLFSSGLELTYNDDIIIANSSSVIQVVNSQGQHRFSRQLDSTILSARAGKNKIAIYVRQEQVEQSPAYILIFDLNGNELFKIEVTDDYILDYGFDAESSSLYLLELDVSGSAPISRISTYRPETQSMTGIKELKDQLVSRLHIIGEYIYAVGTNRLTVYNSFLSSDDKSVMVYGWLLNDICRLPDPRFVFIPAQNEGAIDIARIIKGSGSEVSINLPPDIFDIIHGKDKIYCFANKNIFVYTVDGKYERTYSFSFEINSVKRAFGNYVFITKDGDVYLMPLP